MAWDKWQSKVLLQSLETGARIRIEEVGQPNILESLNRTLAIPIQPTSLCNSHISEIIVQVIFDYFTLHASVS